MVTACLFNQVCHYTVKSVLTVSDYVEICRGFPHCESGNGNAQFRCIYTFPGGLTEYQHNAQFQDEKLQIFLFYGECIIY